LNTVEHLTESAWPAPNCAFAASFGRATLRGMMDLRQVVERYGTLAGNFGDAVPLEKFGLKNEETERLLSALDEDYHISRFLKFSRLEGKTYQINGEAVTHLAVDPAIRSIL
jgi:hypothetical protein